MTFDTDYQSNPVCPHCGYQEKDSREIDFSKDDYVEIECARCSETIGVERHVDVTYSTRKP